MQYIYDYPLLLAIVIVLFTAGITTVVIPSLVNIAKIKNLVSNPNNRTSHKGSVPSLGGVAIFAAMGLAALLFVDFNKCIPCSFFLAGLFIVFFLGLKDDIIALDPYKKFAGQIFAAIIIVFFGHTYISNLHGFLGINELTPAVGMFLSIIFIVGLTNSINLIDGIDGLAASVGIMATVAFGSWFLLAGHTGLAIISFAIMGSYSAFVFFNLSQGKNKIFLGDSGSLILGFSISFLAIQFMELNIASSAYQIQASPAVVFGFLVIPVFDTGRVALLRMSMGRSPFTPDKLHVHHRLLFLYLSHLNVTIILVITNSLFIVAAITLERFLDVHILFGLEFLAAVILSYIPVHKIKLKNYSVLTDKEKIEYHKVRPYQLRQNDRRLKILPRLALRSITKKR